MHDFTLLTTDGERSAITLGASLAPDLPRRPSSVALHCGNGLTTAAVAARLLSSGHQVIMIPASLASTRAVPDCDFEVRIDSDRVHVQQLRSIHGTSHNWQVALFSSGSTRNPRAFAFSSDALATTVAWYRGIYAITSRSLIATTLPVSYNFATIAGLYQALVLGCTFAVYDDPSSLMRSLYSVAPQFDRCVVLANPVVVDELFCSHSERLPANVLVDSGGAPLSRFAVADFRQRVADLREGYGLTETASLTHFDVEGNEHSLGTVGRPLTAVLQRVSVRASRPILEISSPNAGSELSRDGELTTAPSWIDTGDCCTIDGASRVRLLGRFSDYAIADMWPKDVLDLIGPILGGRTALIAHPSPRHISVRLWSNLNPVQVARLRDRILRTLNSPYLEIAVQRQASLLHSRKLSRDLSDHSHKQYGLPESGV